MRPIAGVSVATPVTAAETEQQNQNQNEQNHRKSPQPPQFEDQVAHSQGGKSRAQDEKQLHVQCVPLSKVYEHPTIPCTKLDKEKGTKCENGY